MTERKLRKLLFGSVPIETERLTIRYIRYDDAADMFDYASLSSVTEYLLWYPHTNIDATMGYIESLNKRYLRGLYGDWAIALKESDIMIGTIGFANIISKEKTCEIGYVLSPKYQHNGYMTEAFSALLDIVFNKLCFKKAILRIISDNAPSVNMAKRFGFYPQYTVTMNIKEKSREVIYYQLLKDDYKQKNEAVD